ncbi:hypothetical protein AB4499_21110 [Vibrio cyclitrophicus]
MDIVNIQGRQITSTQVVHDFKNGQSLQALELLYPLREVDFERLKNGNNKYKAWSIQFTFLAMGYSLNLIAKGYSDLSLITSGEWISLSVCGAPSLILFVIGCYSKDKKKELMDKIDCHFSDDKAPEKQG